MNTTTDSWSSWRYLQRVSGRQRPRPACDRLWAAVRGDGGMGRVQTDTPAPQSAVWGLCAAGTKIARKPKWAGEPRGRKKCGIKPCYHGLRHRPAMRAGDAVLKRFQPLFCIFLMGPVLSLFWRCNQICYHLTEKCCGFNGSHSFKCAITTILLELEVFLNGRRESEIPDADRS